MSGLNVNDFAGLLGGLGVTCFIERAVFLGGFIIRVAGKLIHPLLAVCIPYKNIKKLAAEKGVILQP